MNTRFGLICAAATVILAGGIAMEAKAQIVTITASGYVAPGSGTGPKADPQGTWSKPVDKLQWQVTVDYGTVTNGTFTKDFTIGAGFDKPCGAAASGTWGPIGAETLKNPLPANTHIRARIQKWNGSAWVDQGAPAYLPIP